jgi:hypothetical protein
MHKLPRDSSDKDFSALDPLVQMGESLGRTH